MLHINIFFIKSGDEFSKCEMILTGDTQINRFDNNTRSILKHRIDFNNKSLSLFKVISFKKKHRKDFSWTLCSNRYFSDAFIVNINSHQIKDKDHKIKPMLSLDLKYSNDKFKISNEIANTDTLYMGFNQLKNKKDTILEERLLKICKEIKKR